MRIIINPKAYPLLVKSLFLFLLLLGYDLGFNTSQSLFLKWSTVPTQVLKTRVIYLNLDPNLSVPLRI